MANDKGKNILVDRGIQMLPDLGSSDRAAAEKGNGGSSSGWSVNLGNTGGGGAGPRGSGLGPGRGRRRGITNKQAKRLYKQQQAAQAKAEAELQAQAQLEQAKAAHAEFIDRWTRTYSARKAELDGVYAQRSSKLAQQLEAEINAAKKAPSWNREERWQLYLISKEKSEIAGIIARKQLSLNHQQSTARSFYNDDPLTTDVSSYQNHLAAHNSDSEAANTHQRWESSYTAAQEAKLLSDSIRYLSDRYNALTVQHAEASVRYREVDAIHEGHRKYAEHRRQQIKHALRVNEDVRRDRVKTTNTVVVRGQQATGGALVLNRTGAVIAAEVAAALDQALVAAAKELVRIAVIRTGQTISMAATALFWSEDLGNGELTPEQRRRLFQGIGTSTNAVGLSSSTDLSTVAQAGGSVDLPARIKAVPGQKGMELHVVSTGTSVPAKVPVIQAELDALTGTYKAQTPGSSPRYLSFDTTATGSSAANTFGDLPELFKGERDILDIPAGVDTRIQDCIVCFPAELGWPPRYFTFYVENPDSGVVKGSGQAVSGDWWKNTAQERGAMIPAQLADVLRAREYKSPQTFERAVWKSMAQDASLTKDFNELNRARMMRGHAPYAPKADWSADRREFELRFTNAANDSANAYDLDRLSITRPNSAHGARRIAPTFLPWPVSTGRRTWTPLIPPGSESTGPTELPAAEQLSGTYPGATTNPVGTQTESYPAVDPQDVLAHIPGYGEDDDLPSPDLMFAGPPVEPLETGDYDDLASRSRLDGLDIDHMPSQQALKHYLLKRYPNTTPLELRDLLRKASSIAIPAEVHRRYSETYGGRNTETKQREDAADLRAAVDSNFDAIKPGLLEAGFTEKAIEAARAELHENNDKQGRYL